MPWTKTSLCGYCHTAWDIVAGRARSTTEVSRWLEFCKVGGCDPDIWDYVEDPKKEFVSDNRFFHLRDTNVPFHMRTRPKAKKVVSRPVPAVADDDVDWV